MKSHLLKVLLLIPVFIFTGCSMFKFSATEQDKVNQSSYSDLTSKSPAQVGQAAPQFELADADGVARSLAEFTDQQAVLLVFYRGDWCPFCISQLDSIKQVLPQLKEKNVQVLAISPDQKSAAQNTRRQFSQGFIFLTDPTSSVIEQYGIARENKLPHPAVYLIKKGGQMAWFYASEDYKKRPSGEQLLQIVNSRL